MRLTLNPSRIESMALGLEEVASMSDPIGEIIISLIDRVVFKLAR